ncbi:glutamine--fructose-6-phosphate transaminase (isomerizing) [Sinimarinibacterium sp. CAU 1509]|uniref:glutamine--fructose-6-phosphate transaminase (isomerizing) n=1 Tax=Sinimarinibacterium sp. CAU 1509 TaxID=2562283 RepID=UPI0010AB5D06|nr:glutamine--fructose-6-phosphate transaminase (isomerizing) [Sinimarinibacterium sp. CAU 1509]TJY59730.1 glutamine--fructose-6-phosphate transaminase (isomerizing) [Sinimarinibacterium sp. CAU 1509]
MCGIVGAIAPRDVTPILIEGLRRLEYRGYDSTGVALVDGNGQLALRRAVGKVARLEEKLTAAPCSGAIGIAHSRWATHGGVTEANAHPHVSGGRIAVIHNGIIENYEPLRAELLERGYVFQSETDTEVIAHLIHDCAKTAGDLTRAVQQAVARLTGAYAIVVFDAQVPDRIVVARIASPLVIGLGEGENFVASDVQALLPETRRFIFLEEGDVADIRRDTVEIFNQQGEAVTRPEHVSSLSADAVERGEYAHYMLKEIYEQPRAIADTLSERIVGDHVLEAAFGPKAATILPQVMQVHIVACGTSYHAGLVARYYLEQGARIPCTVEVASEYRYRNPVVSPNTLFLAISQSGETADTLAALREAKKLGYVATAAICNVPESSLVREADLSLMTRAGPEVGVASTKAFTTQLAALSLLGLAVAQRRGIDRRITALYARQIRSLPEMVEHTLKLDAQIKVWAEQFADKHHALFLGRGPSYPIALEGALKLKEISYIHAEAYPAGELKHGPLALVDDDMPVIAVAPNDRLLEKLKSNLQEVRARGARLFVFADPNTGFEPGDGIEIMTMPDHIEPLQSPLLYTIPLQLLAYHVAVLRGTDVDQPRNLAKSVTVE